MQHAELVIQMICVLSLCTKIEGLILVVGQEGGGTTHLQKNQIDNRQTNYTVMVMHVPWCSCQIECTQHLWVGYTLCSRERNNKFIELFLYQQYQTNTRECKFHFGKLWKNAARDKTHTYTNIYLCICQLMDICCRSDTTQQVNPRTAPHP